MKILILMICILIVSCTNVPRTDTDKRAESYDYIVIEIENCEYIICHPQTSSETMTHKGNCKNHLR